MSDQFVNAGGSEILGLLDYGMTFNVLRKNLLEKTERHH